MGNVLAVDDDDSIRSLLTFGLGREHRVTAVATGEDAVLLVAAGERFDAILCDIGLPGMSGTEVRTAIALIDAEQARRVVFLGGSGVAGGSFRCVAKPFNLSELRAIIGGFLPIRLLPKQSGVRAAVEGYGVAKPVLRQADADLARAQWAINQARRGPHAA